jgi:hypothetical protein
MGSPHPILDCAKDVLDEAAPEPLSVRHLIQALLLGWITASCSQRMMIRCWVGVHWGLSWQVKQALRGR